LSTLYLIRHYPTNWNVEKRIQGRTDIPLSTQSLAQLSKIELASNWRQYRWLSSPLTRTRQTAAGLGVSDIQLVEPLQEMHWGEFEGMTLAAIANQIKIQNINPPTGLHFRPPGGESPAEVCERFRCFLSTLTPEKTVAVTHKGVIRAAISIATGWDMEAPFNQSHHTDLKNTIDWSLPLKFERLTDNRLQLLETNVRDWCQHDEADGITTSGVGNHFDTS